MSKARIDWGNQTEEEKGKQRCAPVHFYKKRGPFKSRCEQRKKLCTSTWEKKKEYGGCEGRRPIRRPTNDGKKGGGRQMLPISYTGKKNVACHLFERGWKKKGQRGNESWGDRGKKEVESFPLKKKTSRPS